MEVNLSTHAASLSLHGKSCRYQNNRRLGGPQARSQRSGDEVNLFFLPGFEARFLYCKTCAIVTIRNELPRLLTCQYLFALYTAMLLYGYMYWNIGLSTGARYIRYIILYLYIFNFNLVDTRWQQFSTHLRTNSTQNTENGTYITIQNRNIHNNKK
jgi:hypothetical protein